MKIQARKEPVTNPSLGMMVFHEGLYKGRELMKIVGIREHEIELRGDIVLHKLSNEVYRILKVSECVAICQCPPYCSKMGWFWNWFENYICSTENLEPYPQGQFIFDWIDTFDESEFIDFVPAYRNRWKQLIGVMESEPKAAGTQLKLI